MSKGFVQRPLSDRDIKVLAYAGLLCQPPLHHWSAQPLWLKWARSSQKASALPQFLHTITITDPNIASQKARLSAYILATSRLYRSPVLQEKASAFHIHWSLLIINQSHLLLYETNMDLFISCQMYLPPSLAAPGFPLSAFFSPSDLALCSPCIYCFIPPLQDGIG